MGDAGTAPCRALGMRRHDAAPGLKRAVLAKLCIVTMDTSSNIFVVIPAPDSPPAQ